ncbi:hypothetical protein Ccar_15765 [Clostridium carboxidivorans P7]|uniref:Uncharacterized protein n=1 Tax=Clostridium carboxidivorans P7 TaxID=536227 RepID=C6Q0Z5_9CLOT|nr:hypothetical protein [Clostridium carboxidivorans]AKN32238.1 hypothetical protein Ccar_15765 [Clostridium carboxidivorans P7]EET84840.1 hypothetical protein CcarbDRAFT_4712 [Clostridium carboxidivorans P7]
MDFHTISNGTDIDSRIPLNCEIDNFQITYLEESRELKFLDKGTYVIELKLIVSETNEANSIGIKFGEELIKEYNVPIKKSTEVVFNFTINVDTTDKTLSVINTSDDNLNLVVGGVNMDVSSASITSLNDPISITNIDQINNKTITVTLNKDFTGNEVFKVFKTGDIHQAVKVIAVQDSVNPASNKRVVVAYDTGVKPYDIRFQTGVSYTLKISSDTEEAKGEFIVKEVTPPPMNADIEVFGDRILNVKMDVPVQNLDYLKVVPGTQELNNFYVLFYDKDTNVSQDPAPQWIGTLDATTDEQDVSKTVITRVAPDYRSMEIQFNHISLPVGAQQLIVNFSKIQEDSIYKLKDFSNDQRVVPTMSKDFTVIKGANAAVPMSVVTSSRTEIIVKFDKPILNLYSEKDAISVENVPTNVLQITRVGNKFNTLKYTLSNTTPLPIGKVNITVGRITDANGYKTMQAIFKDVIVVDNPPRILKVEQIEIPSIPNTTQILVTFSKDMKDTDTEGGVRNPNYYVITKPDTSIVTIKTPITYDASKFAATITTEKLDPGVYNLFAQDIQDVLGLPMKAQNISFIIVDNTEPKVTGITFRNNTMVIKFNEMMQTSGEHSITEIQNYLIEDGRVVPSKKEVLLPETVMLTMKNSKWVRITLPTNSIILPLAVDPNYLVHIGYAKLKEIRYIQDVGGNIYPLCNLHQIDSNPEEFDVSNGTVTVISDSRLQYKYLGQNELYSINISDFEVSIGTAPGVVVAPLTITLKDEKTIEFNFPSNTFDGGTDRVVIGTKNTDMQSRDIYGYAITKNKSTNGTVVNGLRAELQAVSLVTDKQQGAVVIRMTFNKSIDKFAVEDFGCLLNNSQSISMKYNGNNFNNKKVFEVVLQTTQPLRYTDELVISLAVPEQLIRTLDIDGNKIAMFTPIKLARFIAQSIKWQRTSSQGISNNKVTIEFNYPINTRTVIPDSKFDGTDKPWDGITPLAIGAGNLEFNHSVAGDTITIKNNEQFGTIEIANKLGSDFVPVSCTNNKDVVLSLVDGNKLVLQFDAAEDALVHPQAINFVTYAPNIDANNTTIQNVSNVLFLYSDYQPTSSPNDV